MPLDLSRPRDLGRVLDDAFRLYRERWRTLLALAALVVVPVELLALGVGFGWLWGPYDDDMGVEELVAQGIAPWLVVTPLVTALTAHVVAASARGEDASAGAALRAVARVAAPLLIAMLLVAAGVIAGLAAFVVPGIAVAVGWTVVAQSVLFEDRRGFAALRRSWGLVRGSWWWTFVVLLVVNVLVAVVSAVVILPLDAAAREADSQAISLVGSMLTETLTLPLVAAAGTLVYFTLRAKEDGAPAEAPGVPRAEEPQLSGDGRGLLPPAPPPSSDDGPQVIPPAPPPSGDDDGWEQRRREGWEPPRPGG